MLSVNLLQRYVDGGQYEKLVRGLSANGTPLPLPLEARLSYPAAALGMGLHRLVELTYGPTSLSRAMGHLLIHLQQRDGSYAGSSEADPLATAAAAAGLGKVVADHPRLVDEQPRLAQAHDRAIHALARMQDEAGLFAGPDDRTRQDAALTSAFVLVMLAQDARFREWVRYAQLMSWFDEHSHSLDRHAADLYHLARADQPRRIENPMTLAGIAA